MSTDTPRPERVSLRDAMLTGLHEAGWFARADIEPDHLNGLVHDATDAISEWLDVREQELREEHERIEAERDALIALLRASSRSDEHTYHYCLRCGREAEAREAEARYERDAAREQALRDEIAANIRTTLADPERVRPRRKDAESATDLADDVEWAAMIAEGGTR